MHGEGRRDVRHQRHGGDHGRGAGHVGLHVLHSLRRLERQAARVEGDGFAHQRDRLSRLLAARDVAQAHQPRLLGATLRHAEEQVHVQLPDLREPEHLDLQPTLARHRARRGRELPGGHAPRWLVHQVAGKAGGFCQARPQAGGFGEPRACLRLATPTGGALVPGEDLHPAELERLLLPFVLVERVGSQRGPLR